MSSLLGCVCIIASGSLAMAQNQVTISGKVKFTEPDFKVQLYKRIGWEKVMLGEAPVNADKSYSLTVKVDKPGQAVLDCAHWQSVNVWLEDENLGVDFRGLDTAKIKIKNPPYVYINGGKNSEVMNLLNFESYRSYQGMIAISQNAYRAKFESDEEKQNFTMKMYDYNNENLMAHVRYFVEHYSDRNAVMAAINFLDYNKNKDLIDAALAKLEKVSPVSKELANEYLANENKRMEQAKRMEIGQPAPAFTCVNAKGKTISLADFKGKVLVLDFWASWCGPCRAETPNLKEIYADMNKKDVEFLSVSIDENKDAWLKAVKEDGASWRQGWVTDSGKKVMETYQFGGIPFILVIDKNGKLYRKQVRGKNIRTAIEDCLSGKPATPATPQKTMSMGAAMM